MNRMQEELTPEQEEKRLVARLFLNEFGNVNFKKPTIKMARFYNLVQIIIEQIVEKKEEIN
jgi:hypothetical protein